jgi:hypothetical protein
MTDVMEERDFEHAVAIRKLKRNAHGCLITADYTTPASDQMYGYVLEAERA